MSKTENRGFFHFDTEEPIDAHLAGIIRGFAKGRTYTLEDGQAWMQIDDTEIVRRTA